MLVVTLDTIMNVRISGYLPRIRSIAIALLGFEDGEYYPEKHPDHRLRRERVPVRKCSSKHKLDRSRHIGFI